MCSIQIWTIKTFLLLNCIGIVKEAALSWPVGTAADPETYICACKLNVPKLCQRPASTAQPLMLHSRLQITFGTAEVNNPGPESH